MLGCNHDITVWIRKKNPDLSKAGKEIFTRHVLPVKCRWKNFTGRNTGGGTANIYNNAVIIIPYFDGICDLHIKEGDFAAPGVYETDITGVSPYTASEIRRLLSPNITIVNSVSYNFDSACRNSIGMKGGHLRLTGN